MKPAPFLISGILVLLTLALACNGGVSVEELNAVKADLEAKQARVRELEAKKDEVQQRLARTAAIAEVLELFTNPPEGVGAPDAKLIQQLTPLVEASGDSQLQAKWAEIAGAVFSSAGPPPFALLGELGALVQQSGDARIQQKFHEFTVAALRGEGATPAIELVALIQAGGDPSLQAKMQEFVQAVVKNAEVPGRLFEEFAALAMASENEALKEKVQELAALPPAFVESFEAKVRAIGDPILNSQLEDLFTPGLGAERHGEFLTSLIATLTKNASQKR